MTAVINRSRALVEELAAIRFEDLSGDDVAQLETLILDQTAVALYGASTPWGGAIKAYAERMDGTGAAPVIASEARVIPTIAALANGAMTHSYELDDTHDVSMSHPGSVVISSAVATAIEYGATGRDLFAAIAGGYEAVGRIGAAANAKEVIEFGFHPTGVFCGFGAVVASARLRGLGVEQICHGWGHMLSLASGAMQFADEPAGTAVKRMHAGYAAHNALLAVEMAASGVAAPEMAIDGRFGFLNLFGRDSDASLLERVPGARLELHNISIKPYSCCRLFHSTIDALETVTDNFTADIETIEKIVIRGPQSHADQHMIRRPTSVMAAQYSLPFIVGATLAEGPQAYDAYGEDRHSDPKILRLADMVETQHDADIEAVFPRHFGSGVDITMKDGTVRSETLLDSVGTPGRPMNKQQVVAKAVGLTASVAPAFDAQAAMAVIESLKQSETVAIVSGLIRGDTESAQVDARAIA